MVAFSNSGQQPCSCLSLAGPGPYRESTALSTAHCPLNHHPVRLHCPLSHPSPWVVSSLPRSPCNGTKYLTYALCLVSLPPSLSPHRQNLSSPALLPTPTFPSTNRPRPPPEPCVTSPSRHARAIELFSAVSNRKSLLPHRRSRLSCRPIPLDIDGHYPTTTQRRLLLALNLRPAPLRLSSLSIDPRYADTPIRLPSIVLGKSPAINDTQKPAPRRTIRTTVVLYSTLCVLLLFLFSLSRRMR